MKETYDIFISYRRDGGESTAKILRDKLTELGYHVFFDVESLRSGDFNTRLYSVIDECQDFLIILSPSALERCENEDDWVRLEIEHALGAGKNIIPIMLRGFTFPKELPPSIEPLRYKNGLESNYQFFDAFIGKLQDFLMSKPSARRWIPQKKLWRFLLPASAAVIAAAAVCFALPALRSEEYPKNAEEQNLTETLLYYVQQNMTQMELAAEYMDSAYRECGRYLDRFEDSDPSGLRAELQNALTLLGKLDTDSAAMADGLRSGLSGSPFSAADAIAVNDYLVQFRDSAADQLYFMEYVTDKNSYIDLDVREDILDCYQAVFEEKLNLIAYGINRLLLPITDEEALSQFKYEFLPQLYYIPLQAASWSSDSDALASALENSLNSIDKNLDRVTLLVGEENAAAMQEKAGLVQALINKGVPADEAEEQVQELIGESGQLAASQRSLRDAEQKLEGSFEEARRKFAPDASDSADTLWGKMLRFLNLGLYDEALSCLDYYREQVRDSDEYAEEYTASAARFINNISATGIDYGLIVSGYEPGKPHSQQYEIGDIIISLNGNLCRNYEEYSSAKAGADEEYTVVVLRASDSGDGTLEQVQLTIPADAPRVQIRELTEKSY